MGNPVLFVLGQIAPLGPVARQPLRGALRASLPPGLTGAQGCPITTRGSPHAAHPFISRFPNKNGVYQPGLSRLGGLARLPRCAAHNPHSRVHIGAGMGGAQRLLARGSFASGLCLGRATQSGAASVAPSMPRSLESLCSGVKARLSTSAQSAPGAGTAKGT